MRDLMATTAEVRAGIEAIDGLEIVGDPIGPVLAMQSDTIDRATASDDERGCPLPKFFREIVWHLVHVHTNAEDGEMRRFWLRAHFYQYSCNLAVLDINVVR